MVDLKIPARLIDAIGRVDGILHSLRRIPMTLTIGQTINSPADIGLIG
jgi:hypothetical protein